MYKANNNDLGFQLERESQQNRKILVRRAEIALEVGSSKLVPITFIANTVLFYIKYLLRT